MSCGIQDKKLHVAEACSVAARSPVETEVVREWSEWLRPAVGQSWMRWMFQGNSRLPLLLDFIMPTPKATLRLLLGKRVEICIAVLPMMILFLSCATLPYIVSSLRLGIDTNKAAFARRLQIIFPQIALRCYAYFHILQHPLFEV